MNELFLTEETNGISQAQLEGMLDELLAQYSNLRKVLIIPPDYTRCYSYAGIITQILYRKLADVHVDVMPALGTHMPMSKEEIESVGYQWADYDEITKRYDPFKLKEGWNVLDDGEEIYFVGKPAIGLWKYDR